MILQDYSKKELEGIVVNLGFPKFRGTQLFQSIWQGLDESDSKINLPKDFLKTLKDQNMILQSAKIIKKVVSKDHTTKFLFQLFDNQIIEGVLMEYKYGNTLCVSTQVGCKMNCAFCASGLKFVRQLSAGEMLGQIVAVNKFLGGNLKNRQITNIVLMGSGEPLDNYNELIKFLKLITNKDGLNISVRNITVSTCGIPSKIEKLADEGMNVNLAISLHSSFDDVRETIMPIAKSYSIKSIIEAAKYYNTLTSRRVYIEYALIDGVNCSVKDALNLAYILKDLQCHVNLIKLNPVPERGLKPASEDDMAKFMAQLLKNNISVTMRRTTGDDVSGACGQLRAKHVTN